MQALGKLLLSSLRKCQQGEPDAARHNGAYGPAKCGVKDFFIDEVDYNLQPGSPCLLIY
jgi:hypothetical protein